MGQRGIPLPQASWRWYFRFVTMLSIPFSILAFWLLPSTNAVSKLPGAAKLKRMDLVGVFIMVACLSLFILGFTSAGSDGWSSANFLAPFLIALALFGVFIAWEAYLPDGYSLLPKGMWRYPNIFPLMAVALVCFVSSRFLSFPVGLQSTDTQVDLGFAFISVGLQSSSSESQHTSKISFTTPLSLPPPESYQWVSLPWSPAQSVRRSQLSSLGLDGPSFSVLSLDLRVVSSSSTVMVVKAMIIGSSYLLERSSVHGVSPGRYFTGYVTNLTDLLLPQVYCLCSSPSIPT